MSTPTSSSDRYEAARAALAAFDSRYPPGHKRREEAVARLDEELRLIDGLGLSGFFTLHHEILELAREIAVEVRGQASHVCAGGRGQLLDAQRASRSRPGERTAHPGLQRD